MNLKGKKFEYNTNVVTKRQYDEHMKLYEGYISKSNEIEEKLKTDSGIADANAVYSKYRGLKTSQPFALNGVMLHELYFQNMGMKGAKMPSYFAELFIKNFSGVEHFFNDFSACAKACRGWCVFGYEQRSQSFMNICMDAHDKGYVALLYPIIILDMYEHAYFMDYGTNKAEYISNFISAIRWDVVEKRLRKLNLKN